MKIQFRKDLSPWNWSKEIYEWKPIHAQTWFKIHRKNIMVLHKRKTQGLALERNIFNQTLQGQTLTLKATYIKGTTKTLLIEGKEND